MKKVTQNLILIFLLLNMPALIANDELLESKATIDGLITCDKQIVKNVKILITSKNEILGEVYSDDAGKFNIPLDFGRIYMLVVGNEKFSTKWVEISTDIPEKFRAKNHTVECVINIKTKNSRVSPSELAVLKP